MAQLKILQALVGTGLLVGGCVGNSPPAGNAALGIAEFQVAESSSLESIVGLDVNGAVVATYEVKLDRYVMSPMFADGVEGLQVDGRRITIDVGTQHGYYEGVDYPDMTELIPAGDIGTFVSDPHVAPVLARWGIFYQPPGASALLAGEVMYKHSDDPPPSGMIANSGYSDGRTCEGVTCGYVFGVAGTQQISRNVAVNNVKATDTNGACALGNGCAVCGGGIGTPATYFATITASTLFGDLPNQTYIAELCTNPNHVPIAGTSVTGAFFEVKACRINGVNLATCPSGGQSTSCGCTANPNIKCKPCTAFISQDFGHEPFVPPFGEVDATVHNPISDEASDALKHQDGFDWEAANFLQWSYGPTCREKQVYCTEDVQCCSGFCGLKEFGWGTCKNADDGDDDDGDE